MSHWPDEERIFLDIDDALMSPTFDLDDPVEQMVATDALFGHCLVLARVVAARTAALRSFHRLAVDHAGSRDGFTPGLVAHRHAEHVVDRGERAVARPCIEIALHGRVGRKLFRQLLPLAAGAGHVQDRVHHGVQIRLAWPPDPRRRRHNWRQQVHSASVRSLAYRSPSRRQ